jgi:hypothetical protein
MKFCCTILLLLFAIISVDEVKAQKLVFVFAHAEYASPVGKLRNANNAGLGVEAGVGVGTGKTFLTGTVGTTWLATNKRAGSTTQGGLKYTPYKLGLRRYVFLKNVFVKADAGLATVKIIDTDIKSSNFTTSFGAGVKFTAFEAVVDYNSVGSYGSWFGLKVGLAIGL